MAAPIHQGGLSYGQNRRPTGAHGGRKFDKAKSVGRIDGLVALAMALSVALVKTPKTVDIEALIA